MAFSFKPGFYERGKKKFEVLGLCNNNKKGEQIYRPPNADQIWWKVCGLLVFNPSNKLGSFMNPQITTPWRLSKTLHFLLVFWSNLQKKDSVNWTKSQFQLYTIESIKKVIKLHLFIIIMICLLSATGTTTLKGHTHLTFDLLPGFNAMPPSKAKQTFSFCPSMPFNSRSDPKKSKWRFYADHFKQAPSKPVVLGWDAQHAESLARTLQARGVGQALLLIIFSTTTHKSMSRSNLPFVI